MLFLSVLASLISGGYPYAGASARRLAPLCPCLLLCREAGRALGRWQAASRTPPCSPVSCCLLPAFVLTPAGEWFEAKAQPGEHLEPLDEQRAVVVANLW